MSNLKIGTAGGTLFVLLSNLGTDIARTALMSAVAAIVSYLVSCILNHLLRKPDK